MGGRRNYFGAEFNSMCSNCLNTYLFLRRGFPNNISDISVISILFSFSYSKTVRIIHFWILKKFKRNRLIRVKITIEKSGLTQIASNY
jgi:hypothetical protein